MLKLHESRIPIYDIRIVFTQDLNKFYDYCGISGYDDNNAGLCCWQEDIRTVAIYTELQDDISTIPYLAHECFHAVLHITEDVGIITTSANDEAAAYIMTWLMEYCLTCIDKDAPP